MEAKGRIFPASQNYLVAEEPKPDLVLIEKSPPYHLPASQQATMQDF